MLLAEFGQCVQRAVPVAARLVREDGRGLHQLARRVHHGHLHAGADARVQAHHDAGSGGGCEQQVAQVVGKHLDRHLLGLFTQAGEEVALGGQAQLHAPGPGNAFADQVIGGAACVAPSEVQGDLAFSDAGLARLGLGIDARLRLGQHKLRIQNFQRAAPKHRQGTVRRHTPDRLVVVKVVAKLRDVGVVLILTGHQLRLEEPFSPQPLTQPLHQGCVFGPALAQDVAHAIQHGLHGAEVVAVFGLLWQYKRQRRVLWIQSGVSEQLVGQRLDAGLTRNQALGSAAQLEGQVQVFQLLFCRRGLQRGSQFGRQFALLVDVPDHGLAPVFKLAQVTQASLEFAQLDVVQPAGDFLPVAGNERHGGATVQQVHGGLDLACFDPDFCGDLPDNFCHVGNGACNAF